MILENVHPLMSQLDHALEQLDVPDAIYDRVDVMKGQGTYVQWNLNDDSWHYFMGLLGASIPSVFDTRLSHVFYHLFYFLF